ncbi:serine hydrolase [Streptomyces sp. NPDC059943]|uniref:serine hydrolase n=1 Tax=Streptomyces sp. NPDC059943 TaxID=3347010 RepID=UPI003663AFF1
MDARREHLTDIAGIAATADESVTYGVAVRDIAAGRTTAHHRGPTPAHPSASVVKLGILVALLLRCQDAGREPTAEERVSAAQMMERSDNDAATALWHVIGGADAMDAAHRRIGLRESAAAPEWGLSRTTATDQLTLLAAVFGEGATPLSERSRAFVVDLMTHVVADQAWGVSAAGSAPALKNGWMPLSATGLWVVNSVGRVTAGGRDVLVAVLSGGHPTKDAGMALVERAARAAVSAVGAR